MIRVQQTKPESLLQEKNLTENVASSQHSNAPVLSQNATRHVKPPASPTHPWNLQDHRTKFDTGSLPLKMSSYH
jgi:hypothetical protein